MPRIPSPRPVDAPSPRPMTREYDVIVVGMGVGGEEVAGRLASAGLNVLAVERKLVGGECPYWGCIPSKVMVRAGNTIGEAARVLGLAGDVKISPEWEPVAKRVRSVTADWNDEAAVERLRGKGGALVRGHARITGGRTIEVDGTAYRARTGIVVATGGEPALPPVEGIEDVPYWTNREAIEATDLPRSIIVLGAGAIGLELGQTFHRFGTEVTFVELFDHAMALEEPENGAELDEVIRAEGMTLLTRTKAIRARSSGGEVTLDFSDGNSVTAEKLLVTTGRRLTLDALGVDAVGLDPEAKAVEVDENLRAGDGLWAVGDVTGKGAFTHVAVYQGRIAAADILGEPHSPADYSAVPRVTFTDPELASVGMTEAQARDQGLKVKVGITKTSSSTRGWIHGPGAERGVVKLVADGDRGVLVGASIMGPAAGEIIGLPALAVKEEISIRSLRDLIYPYPTFVRGLEGALEELG